MRPAPIPAFNYLNPNRTQALRISPPQQISSHNNNKSDHVNPLLDYQNIQQSCDTKLLKELHFKQNNLVPSSSSSSTSSSMLATTHTTAALIHNNGNGNRSNNHKGNCDTNLNNSRNNNNKIDHSLAVASIPSNDSGGKGKKNIVEKENHNNHNNIFNKNNNGKEKGVNVIPQQRHHNPKHEYYNVIDNEMRAKSPILRKFGDSIDPHQKRLSPSKSDNKYKLSTEITDRSSDSKLSNFSLSKFLNMDIKSPNISKKPYSNSNSSTNTNSSSMNSFNSFDSVEQAIILSKNTPVEGSSYLGPFNFRQLLRPTQGPTESLRKRKGNVNPPSPPPAQKGKNT